MKKKKGFYSISVVAKMFSVHQQTIRMYEKEGLICPKRSEGNTRLFSEEDVDKLEQIIHLTHKVGVNLAGVDMIFKLQKKIKRMQSDMNKLFEQMHGQLDKESEEYKENVRGDAQTLLSLKEENNKKCLEADIESDKKQKMSDKNLKSEWLFKDIKTAEKEESKSDDGDWELEYEIDE